MKCLIPDSNRPPAADGERRAAQTPNDDLRAAAAMGMGDRTGANVSTDSAGERRLSGIRFAVERRPVSATGTTPSDRSSQGRPFTHLPDAEPARRARGAGDSPPPHRSVSRRLAAGQYWTTPGQFGSGQPQGTQASVPGWGTVSAFQMQSATQPVANPMQAYDQARSQYDSQLNSTIQQVQGAYPSASMQTPSYGLPVERPESASQMMNAWYQGTSGPTAPTTSQGMVTPERYPSSPTGTHPPAGQATPHVSPLPTVNSMTPQLPPAPVWSGCRWSPPAYNSSRSHQSQQSPPAIQPASQGGYRGPAHHAGDVTGGVYLGIAGS